MVFGASCGNRLADADLKWQPDQVSRQRVTMAEIAARVGVSKIAVSMALRDSYRISRQRREEIRRVAKEMGYVPDPFLSALAAHRQQRVAAKDHGVLAWLNHWREPARLRCFREFDGYWLGAGQAAARYGYRLDEVRWEEGCSPKRLERILLARGIDGILVPPHNELIDWGDFDWSKFSVIRFGLSVPSPDSNLVTADLFQAAVMALSRMHEYGYERIGITVNGEFNQRVGGNVLSGYYYACSLMGRKQWPPPLLTFLKTRTADELRHQKEALRLWLKRSRPDAILTGDIEVPRMLGELGYRIPEDLAVAGTSCLDIPGVDTGIDQRSEVIGRTAVEMLLKQMNLNERGEPGTPCRILVQSRWRQGRSLPPRNV
jgi:DNA-binding LacI/PurR family transcriptional regulator